MIFMTHFFSKQKRQFLRPLPLVLGLIAIPSYSAFAQTPSGHSEQLKANLTTLSGGPLHLQQVALITMEHSPAIMVEKLGVHSAIANVQIESGTFDIEASVAGSANERRPQALESDEDAQELTFGLSKSFRTGIQTSASAGVARVDNRIISQNTSNLSTLNLSIIIPLLKGRGYISAAAAETSARLQSQATELEYYHSISNTLLESTNAYWDYRAAIENFKIQKKSEERIQAWDKAVRKGIKSLGAASNESHEAEISRIQGYLADKRGKTIAAIDQVNSTRGALGIVMGIQEDQVDNIGDPSEEFPEDWGNILAKLKQQQMPAKWLAEAKKNRLDIRAAKLNQEASAVNLAKARQDVLPQLNFGLQAGRNATELGDGYSHYTGALHGKPRGTDVGAMLTFSYPLGNNAAEGQRDSANAAHRINVINTNNLIRTISVQVKVDGETLKRRLKESVEAFKAVKLYESALKKSYNSSRNRLLHDPHIIFKLIDIDERVTGANNDFNASLQELAKAIAQLRYQTGTVFTDQSMDAKTLRLGNMSKIPSL
jgi:outer membrane protein